MPIRKPKKGDLVRVNISSIKLIGVVAVNKPHLPGPYQVDVDLEASALDDDGRAYFTNHYAGPYTADELDVIDPDALDLVKTVMP